MKRRERRRSTAAAAATTTTTTTKKENGAAAAAAKEKRGRSLKTLTHLNIIEGFIKFCRRTRSDEKGEDKLEILQ